MTCSRRTQNPLGIWLQCRSRVSVSGWAWDSAFLPASRWSWGSIVHSAGEAQEATALTLKTCFFRLTVKDSFNSLGVPQKSLHPHKKQKEKRPIESAGLIFLFSDLFIHSNFSKWPLPDSLFLWKLWTHRETLSYTLLWSYPYYFLKHYLYVSEKKIIIEFHLVAN